MLYLVGTVAVLVVVVLGAVVALAMRGPSVLPKLPRVERGAEIARVTLRHQARTKTVNAKNLPESELGRFVVFYFDDLLFYYGNGSKAHDQSGPIRADVQRIVADPSAAEWTFDPSLEWSGESVDSTLFESGFSGGRVMGWANQDECRRGGLGALVARAVQGRDGARVKKALTTLIAWQEQHGPMPTMGNAARAHAAWNDIAPLR